MEKRICKSKKCDNELPADSKHKYCEECREKFKRGLKIAGGVAALLAGAAGTAYLTGKLADSNSSSEDPIRFGLDDIDLDPYHLAQEDLVTELLCDFGSMDKDDLEHDERYIQLDSEYQIEVDQLRQDYDDNIEKYGPEYEEERFFAFSRDHQDDDYDDDEDDDPDNCRNLGIAIDMMNGEEDYDEYFVQSWLH